jgi:activating signal cointegrator complex subunit 3
MTVSPAKKFLYIPFPVESCLRGRLCENLNAEIATRTITSLVDTVGYLMWTFFARRVKANPSYYGANSAEDSDVESFLFSVSKDTLKMLQEHGCVEIDGDRDELDGDVLTTSLGAAASEYYLTYRSPKQMQFGVRQCAKIILQEMKDSEDLGHKSSDSLQRPFLRPSRVDEVAVAWLLYTLSCTHEFDELPVRHNEEILNEELSDRLMWGPDTASVLSTDGKSNYTNPEVYADPHTK